MEVEEFIRGLAFKKIQPDTPLSELERIPVFRKPDLESVKLEIENTILPDRQTVLKESLYKICLLPRMSTFAIGCIINQAVYLMPRECAYVNVGVWHGFTFFAGMVNNPGKKCIGIDNFSEFNGPRKKFLLRFTQYKSPCHFFYNMDYEDYFQRVHRELIGVYMYDGAHDYDNQLKGLRLAEPYFSRGCIILVDDINWEEPRSATLDFINDSSREYEIILDKQTSENRNPTWWNGVMILKKIS